VNVRIVLIRSRNPLNIGAAARAMANFGLEDLVVVEPYAEAWREARSAVGAGAVMRSAREATLPEAVRGCHLVLGTTALRRRDPSQAIVPLPGLGGFLQERLPGGRGRAALLFGSEKHGLRNEDLRYCHALLTVPTRPETPSMNVGQAVAVAAYELARSGLEKALRDPLWRPPTTRQLEDLLRKIESAFRTVGFMAGMPAEVRERKLRGAVRRLVLRKADAALMQAFLKRVATQSPVDAPPRA